MTSRERILAAIDRKPVDRIPLDYWGTGEATASLMKHLGVSDGPALWRKLEIDKIHGVMPAFLGPAITPVEGRPRDYFGVEYRPVEYGSGGTYLEVARSPLERFSSIGEIEAEYVWPTADLFDFSVVADRCRALPDYAREGGYMAPFYIYTNVRGMEQCMVDLVSDDGMADYILGKINGFLFEFHRRLFESAGGGIDIAQVTDDFGCQAGLLVSLETFERHFAGPIARFIALTKEHGIRVFHHDDGSIMPLLPRLVELGIEVLNPIQWHLPGMDLGELKRCFGAKIAFHGGIDNQHVLPFGSLEEIEAEVATCIDVLASDGTGYILAPCHNVQPNTPPESVVHMYECARRLGRR
jgi:uroporphyrinogen decarboxylase